MITLKIKSTNSLIPTVITIDKFPCRLGRSIKNTIVLEDASISSEHALINFDQNGYYIMDLDSTNGLFDEQNKKVDKIYLENELHFRIGDLNVEIILGDEFLEKTRIIKLSDYFPTKKANSINFKILLSQICFAILIIISKYLLNPLDKSILQEIILDFGTYTIIITFLSLIFSLFSKLHIKKFRFSEYYFFFSKWLIIFFVFSSLLPFFYFSIYYKDSFWDNFNFILGLSITFYLIYKLAIITFIKTRKKIIMIQVISFCLSILVFFGLINFLDDKDNFEFYGSISYPIKNYTNIGTEQKDFLNNLNQTFQNINQQKSIQIKNNQKNQ